MNRDYDLSAVRIRDVISPGPRLAVVGSGSFWGDDSEDICISIAGTLAQITTLQLITGGMNGVGLTFAREFAKSRSLAGLPENTYHLLPDGFENADCGLIIQAGNNLHDRREIIGRTGDIFLVIEGGPGTEHEVSVALARNVPIIPIGRTGGYAREFFESNSPPTWADQLIWSKLNDDDEPVTALSFLVKSIIYKLFPDII